MSQLRTLLYKEILLEWRQRYALNGILLYLLVTIFVVYLAFVQVRPTTWMALYWIILLFAAVNAVAKSFLRERPGERLYYYSVAAPVHLLTSKLIYNTVFLMGLALLAGLIFGVVTGFPVQSVSIFGCTVMLGSIGMAGVLSIVSVIATKARQSNTLMTILSFPLLIPVLLLSLQLSLQTLGPLAWSDCYRDIFALAALDIAIAGLSYLLFPYLWRE